MLFLLIRYTDENVVDVIPTLLAEQGPIRHQSWMRSPFERPANKLTVSLLALKTILRKE